MQNTEQNSLEELLRETPESFQGLLATTKIYRLEVEELHSQLKLNQDFYQEKIKSLESYIAVLKKQLKNSSAGSITSYYENCLEKEKQNSLNYYKQLKNQEKINQEIKALGCNQSFKIVASENSKLKFKLKNLEDQNLSLTKEINQYKQKLLNSQECFQNIAKELKLETLDSSFEIHRKIRDFKVAQEQKEIYLAKNLELEKQLRVAQNSAQKLENQCNQLYQEEENHRLFELSAGNLYEQLQNLSNIVLCFCENLDETISQKLFEAINKFNSIETSLNKRLQEIYEAKELLKRPSHIKNLEPLLKNEALKKQVSDYKEQVQKLTEFNSQLENQELGQMNQLEQKLKSFEKAFQEHEAKISNNRKELEAKQKEIESLKTSNKEMKDLLENKENEVQLWKSKSESLFKGYQSSQDSNLEILQKYQETQTLNIDLSNKLQTLNEDLNNAKIQLANLYENSADTHKLQHKNLQFYQELSEALETLQNNYDTQQVTELSETLQEKVNNMIFQTSNMEYSVSNEYSRFETFGDESKHSVSEPVTKEDTSRALLAKTSQSLQKFKQSLECIKSCFADFENEFKSSLSQLSNPTRTPKNLIGLFENLRNNQVWFQKVLKSHSKIVADLKSIKSSLSS